MKLTKDNYVKLAEKAILDLKGRKDKRNLLASPKEKGASGRTLP